MTRLMDFFHLLNDLRFCPICAWRLVQHDTDSHVRRCPNHGNVFTIVKGDDGYDVRVDLTSE
jgi:hypothetical protein